MKDPRYLGHDAAYQAISAQLTHYEQEIVRGFDDFSILPQFFGSVNLNQPGLATYSWKRLEKGQPAATSRDGDEENVGAIAVETPSVDFLSFNQMYHLKRSDMERAALSGIPLETETARAVGQNIAETIDYKLWNGNAAAGPEWTAIGATTLGVQDAGNPSDEWDVAGAAYDDILEQAGLLRNVGWDGPIDMLITPGILGLMDRLVSDGTTSFPMTYRTWLKEILNGGNIFVSSHFATAWGGTGVVGQPPATADKLTGATDGATNWCVMNARGQSFRVIYAHYLKSLARPAQEGDVYKNVVAKVAYQYLRPNHLVFRDAIDMVTT